MQSCACGRSGGVCSDKFARMRQLLSVAAGLIGGRPQKNARGLARRLVGPEASAKTGALRRGVERREDAPRAFPSRDRGPAAPRAGAPRRAVPRDPVLASFAITTCARRVEEICHQLQSGLDLSLAGRIITTKVVICLSVSCYACP